MLGIQAGPTLSWLQYLTPTGGYGIVVMAYYSTMPYIWDDKNR